MFALADCYTIEFLNKYPNKALNFWLRAGVGVAFGAILIFTEGYIWYWVAPYILFGFWWPFNTILNILRGKSVFYLGSGPVDRILVKIPGQWHWLMILTVAATGMVAFYGKLKWGEF